MNDIDEKLLKRCIRSAMIATGLNENDEYLLNELYDEIYQAKVNPINKIIWPSFKLGDRPKGSPKLRTKLIASAYYDEAIYWNNYGKRWMSSE